MPGFGPFQTYSDALLAACPLILSLPNAVTVRPSNPNFKLYWELSTEYCAWIYYTPDKQYEMSMVATNTSQGDAKMRTCDIPSHIRDSRYSDGSLGYVFVIHNHPVGNELSRRDIRFVFNQGVLHGFSFEAGEREIPIGIIAFFSKGGPGNASCDGFFQYTPLTGELLRWTVDGTSGLKKEQYGVVRWKDAENFEIEYR
ncbi:MAG: hypothetical protein ACXU86_06010 [Archangium sp.]